MSKDIWHKLPEQPEKDRDVLEKWHHLGITHYTHFVAKNGIAEDNPFTDAWCYLDDLLDCEQELIRTRKALDVALDGLATIGGYLDYNDCVGIALDTKDEIYKVLEQKDVK